MNYHGFKKGELVRTNLEEHLRFTTRAALLAKSSESEGSEKLANLKDFLFRPLTSSLAAELRTVVTGLIQHREPRVDVVNVDFTPDPTIPGRMGLVVDYRIKETKKVDRCQVVI